MGTRHLLLLIPFTSTPRKPSLPSLNYPNNTKWRSNGSRNARGPTFTGPEFGYGPEDGYRYFEWPTACRSAASSSSKRRTWWSDDADYDDDDADGDGYSYDWDFRDMADEFPVFKKVIGAFVWMLPAFAMWLVFGTDTDSFFMTLAVPLGQTALSLVVDKVWASADASSPRGRGRGRRRNKTRKKPSRRAASGRKRSGVKQYTKNGERIGSYQSWMATGDCSFKKGDKRQRNYGGWDELDGVSYIVPGQTLNRDADEADGSRGKAN